MARLIRLSPVALPLLGAALIALVATGCSAPKDGNAGGDTSAGHDQSDSSSVVDTSDSGGGDSQAAATGVHGTVQGTVYLQLYTVDENGDTVLMDWDGTYTSYPFGAIFVAAYSTDSDGKETFYAQDVIAHPTVSPDPGGDAYSFDISTDDVQGVNVYASVDYANDGIISTAEPTGAYPSEISVTGNATVSGNDITVMVPYYDSSGGGSGTGWGYGNGGGGDGCTDTVAVSGTTNVAAGYVEGDVAALIYDTSGAGPYAVDRETPSAGGDGSASAPFSITACANVGDYELLGAWDSNANGLFDPADKWGSYVTDPSTDGNPITIGASSLPGLDVLIPFGDFVPTVVPFVSISGTLTSSTDWSAYAGLYVAALKYRPNIDVSVTDLSAGYDLQSWTNADFASTTSLSYHVEVPANTIIYLWAYSDVDGNGMVNGVGEPVAAVDGSTGRLVTGSTSQGGMDLVLATH